MEKDMGRQKVVDKTIQPLQVGLTTLTPAAVTGGRASNTLGVIPIGNYKGAAAFIDLDKLVNQPLVLAEKAYALDRIDSRNGVQVTVPNGSVIGTVVTGEIEVPAGEVWFLNRLSVTCPAADATGTASFNILVSIWPLTAAGTPKGYFATNQIAMGATTDIDLPAQGELGEELRLVGGSKLVLQLGVTVAFSADKVFRLDPYGRKGKALVA
jgi:hypothetical protein